MRTGLASTIGIFLILLGGIVMAISYGDLSDCLTHSFNSPCWDPRLSEAFGLYVGGTVAVLGTVMLVGPSAARSIGKWRGAGPDSER